MTFKKAKNHGFTRRDILKMIPLKYFFKWTICSLIYPAFMITGFSSIDDWDLFLSIPSNFQGWLIYLFVIWPFLLVIFYITIIGPILMASLGFGVPNSWRAVLDIIFLDVYEIDTLVTGSVPIVGAGRKVSNFNVYHTVEHIHLRFSKYNKNEFDKDLEDAGFTMQELRTYLAGVHMLCLKRTKIPIKYFDITLSDRSKEKVYRDVDKIVLTYDEIPSRTSWRACLPILPKTTKKLRKKYFMLVKPSFMPFPIRYRVSIKPKPFMELFGSVDVGNLTKYDMNRNIIGKVELTEKEKALFLTEELITCYLKYEGRGIRTGGGIYGRVEVGDLISPW